MDSDVVVGNAIVGDAVPMVAKRAYVVLKSPVTLRATTKGGEKIVVTLPIGEKLKLIAKSPEPRNQIPYLCYSEKWPYGFFRVGKNQPVVVEDEVIE